MKKCLGCRLVFHLDDRSVCLYCGSPLVDVPEEEAARIEEGESGQEQEAKTQKQLTADEIQHIAGIYFGKRSIAFMYAFSRNEMKMGKGLKRFFIQPLNFAFIVKIPWLLINVVDSLIFRLIYKGYCQKCDWKYNITASPKEHDPVQCEYNREYTNVLNNILTGEIIYNEAQFEKEAQEKIRTGKHSAYRQLCSQREGFWQAIDIGTILISLWLLFYVVIKLTMPIFASIYDFEWH